MPRKQRNNKPLNDTEKAEILKDYEMGIKPTALKAKYKRAETTIAAVIANTPKNETPKELIGLDPANLVLIKAIASIHNKRVGEVANELIAIGLREKLKAGVSNG